MGRRERRKQQTREALLQAAKALFAEHGFDATTTRAIASRADVGVGTLFNYFPTKTALLFELFHSELSPVAQRSWAAIAADAPLEDQILGLFSAFIGYYEQNPHLAKILVKELLFLDGDESAKMFDFTLDYMVRLTAVITAAQARGALRPDVIPAQVTYHAFALYFMSLVNWLGGVFPDRASLDEQLRAQLRLLLDSLRTPLTTP